MDLSRKPIKPASRWDMGIRKIEPVKTSFVETGGGGGGGDSHWILSRRKEPNEWACVTTGRVLDTGCNHEIQHSKETWGAGLVLVGLGQMNR